MLTSSITQTTSRKLLEAKLIKWNTPSPRDPNNYSSLAAPTTTTVTRLVKTEFRNENKRDYRVSSALLTCQTRRFIRLTCLKSAKDIIQPCEISFRIGAE